MEKNSLSKPASFIVIVVAFTLAMGSLAEAKKAEPGMLSPLCGQSIPPEDQRSIKHKFVLERDPFKPPTEILPTNCPPSDPLCKFDYSQLKVVGLMQMAGGLYLAFVQDPDGRRYSVATGQMIGSATVTQISSGGITLRLHQRGREVMIPIYRTEKET